MKKAILLAGALTVAMAALTACGGTGKAEPETTEEAAAEAATKAQTVTIAAAASLETCLRAELIPLFEKQNPGIAIEGTYDSSGKLQTQIEEGAGIDVFFSAAAKQMDALNEKGRTEASGIFWNTSSFSSYRPVTKETTPLSRILQRPKTQRSEIRTACRQASIRRKR